MIYTTHIHRDYIKCTKPLYFILRCILFLTSNFDTIPFMIKSLQSPKSDLLHVKIPLKEKEKKKHAMTSNSMYINKITYHHKLYIYTLRPKLRQWCMDTIHTKHDR